MRMGDWIIYETKPSYDEAPPTCQYGSCPDRPREAVRFRSPREYVCYCSDHGAMIKSEKKRAESRLRIR